MRGNKRPVSVFLDKETADTFQRLYPYMFSHFVRACVAKACTDTGFFNSVIYGSGVNNVPRL